MPEKMDEKKDSQNLEQRVSTGAGTALALGSGALTYFALENYYWPATYALGNSLKYGVAASLGLAPTPLIPLAVAGLVGWGVYTLMKHSFQGTYQQKTVK